MQSTASLSLTLSLTSRVSIVIIDKFISKSKLRDLYHDSDVFVLPSRGEGWCLPCVEAMAAGLHIIVTNFSGPSAYLLEEHSYPISIMAEYNIDGTAEPNVTYLVRLLQFVYNHKIEAQEIGLKGQKYVATFFNPIVIAQKMLDRLLILYDSKYSDNKTISM